MTRGHTSHHPSSASADEPFVFNNACEIRRPCDTTLRFPDAGDCLHPDWPAAEWNLSGLFAKFSLIADVIRYSKAHFHVDLPIRYVHGAPEVIWNAGRYSSCRPDLDQAERIFRFLNQHGIGAALTFSNHLIRREHLDDPTCNALLERLNRRSDLNAVIVAGDLLSEYIAARYPGIRQIASVIKTTVENGRGNIDYYKTLEKRFDRYVLHPDDNMNLRLIEQLDPSKVELLVNEECTLNYPNRARHYEIQARRHCNNWLPPETDKDRIAKLREEQVAEKQLFERELTHLLENQCRQYRLASGNALRNCNVAPVEMKRLYDKGIRFFKLQGRNQPPFPYLVDLCRYIFEPQVMAPYLIKAFGSRLKYSGQCSMA